MRAASFLCAALALAGCATAPRPIVRQSAALLPGSATVALAPSPPDVTPLGESDRAAIAKALAGAGFVLAPSAGDARYLLVLATAAGPRRIGSLVPPDDAAAKGPPQWIARPPRGIGAGFGPRSAATLSALLLDRSTGREIWRGTLAVPQRGPASTATLATRVLAELPRAQAAGGS